MSDEQEVQPKKTRKSKSKTVYMLMSLPQPMAANSDTSYGLVQVYFYGQAKSEKAVFDKIESLDIAEGEHTFAVASVRGTKTVNVETKRVVTTKKA